MSLLIKIPIVAETKKDNVYGPLQFMNIHVSPDAISYIVDYSEDPHTTFCVAGTRFVTPLSCDDLLKLVNERRVNEKEVHELLKKHMEE